MTLAEVETRLREAMATGLPGLEGQLPMAPRPRPGWPAPMPPPEARPAAALIMLFPAGDGPRLVLTKRASHLPQHPGQVSLPGGAIEPDERVEDAALREAHEEIGVEAGLVRVIGRLTPLHIPVSGFAVHPVVGVCETTPRFRAADREVERVFDVALVDLADPSCVRQTTRTRDGLSYDVPYFDLAGEMIWGATAMILSEFLMVLGRKPDRWELTRNEHRKNTE